MIEIYTDGACKGNGKSDAIGGWGYHVIDRHTTKNLKEDFGGAVGTTNNRMELQAAVEALKFAATLSTNEKMRVRIHTDSNYVYKGITTWIHGWIRKDWKDVKNVDLWKELDSLNDDVYDWNWVKAHAGHEENEYADELANKGCEIALLPEIVTTPTERERFIQSLMLIYNTSYEKVNNLFDMYLNAKEVNKNSLTQLIFLTIMSDKNL